MSTEKVRICGIQREQGWLYFVDKQGDVSRVLMRQEKRKRENTGNE